MRQAPGMHNDGWHMYMEAVMANESPAVPARRLARELKRLRERSGKTQVEVGEYVGTPSTTISKIENGERNVPLPHLKHMIRLYGVDPDHAATLIKLATEAKEPGWWAAYRNIVPKWFTEYVSLETIATQVETYESEYVPGLLQTRAYTEALTLVTERASPSNNTEGFISVRTRRQQRLTAAEPLVLRAVLNEGALLRAVGGPEVMRHQLAALREASSQPNITIQVIPFSAGAHPAMTGPFTLLRFSEDAMNTVFIELRGGAIYREKHEDVERYVDVFRQVSDLALTEEESVALLHEMEKGFNASARLPHK